ncbi:hypothetical protein D0469_03540 [Peribacillus saganii]|uniref:Uncharacterized protein n=1 Tax=Peribacillus saganii TaxID=2303992 RepID=A0A372LSK6_9BACI|nr:hypothetical protein [Peribacillus saganii]RFU71026.1 hypothetical protein D0469_03540 [Peribacillus saganii]
MATYLQEVLMHRMEQFGLEATEAIQVSQLKTLPEETKARLKSYRMSLASARQDDDLKSIAENLDNVLDCLLNDQHDAGVMFAIMAAHEAGKLEARWSD